MKSQLRSELKSRLSQISNDKLSEYSISICEHLNQLLYSYTNVASFAALSLEPLIQLNQKKLILPKCGEGQAMEFFEVANEKDLIRGKYGILEPNPASAKQLLPSQIDAILCPAWGFTPDGKRLGKGGGYYDRYLTRTSATRIGVCFSCQILEQIPTAPHDIAMDILVNEQDIILVNPR